MHGRDDERNPAALPHVVLARLKAAAHSGDVLDFLCREVEARAAGYQASVLRVGPDGRLSMISGPSAPPGLFDRLQGIEPGACAGSCGTVLFTGEPVLVEDTLNDPRWVDLGDLAREFGIRSSWSVPVCIGDGVVRGTFHLTSPRPGLPDAPLSELLETGAYLTGVVFAFCPDKSSEREDLGLLYRLRRDFLETAQAKRMALLTPREQEVLKLVAQGLPSKQIARRLHISEHTVANHRASILRKLEAEGSAELTRIAVHAALVAGLPRD